MMLNLMHINRDSVSHMIDSENGGLVIRDMGDPGFVIDKKSPMEWKQ